MTLLTEISGYDVGDKGNHLVEDICSISVVRSSGMGLQSLGSVAGQSWQVEQMKLLLISME
jgi:hypothetical protein